MSEWTDFDEAAVTAQHSLHSGVCVDGIRGNLLRAAEQSYFDVTSYASDGDDEMAFGLTTSYALVSDFSSVAIPVRRKPNSTAWRGISFSAWTYTSAGTATIRAYLVPFSCSCDVVVDATNGIVGQAAYKSLNIDNTSYEYKTWDTITPYNVFYHDDDDNGIMVPLVWLMLVAKVSTGTATLRVQSMRLREVTT
jgi:hypothetical protein